MTGNSNGAHSRDTKRGVELKAMDEQGHGLARIAMLSGVDSDGDTYAAGAFGEQWAQILGAHNWQMAPIGKARVFERGDEALAEVHLNLDTEAGREWHAALKFDLDGCCEGSPRIQEWSYGFRVLDAAQEERDGERVRVLKRLDVFEVSPVVKGAGVGTGTLAMKSSGRPFAEQLDAAIAELGDIAARTHDLSAMRANEGRALSASRIKQLGDLHSALGALVEEAERPAREARKLAAAHVARQVRHRPR